jgi:tetratricopeptide (TPR) repeat protein
MEIFVDEPIVKLEGQSKDEQDRIAKALASDMAAAIERNPVYLTRTLETLAMQLDVEARRQIYGCSGSQEEKQSCIMEIVGAYGCSERLLGRVMSVGEGQAQVSLKRVRDGKPVPGGTRSAYAGKSDLMSLAEVAKGLASSLFAEGVSPRPRPLDPSPDVTVDASPELSGAPPLRANAQKTTTAGQAEHEAAKHEPVVVEAGARFKSATRLLAEKKNIEAAREFVSLVDANPDYDKADAALLNAALALQDAHLYKESADILERIVTDARFEKSQHFESALFNLAENSKRFDNFAKAIWAYRTLYDKYPNGVNASYALYQAAELLEYDQQLEEAIELFKRYVKVFPERELLCWVHPDIIRSPHFRVGMRRLAVTTPLAWASFLPSAEVEAALRLGR